MTTEGKERSPDLGRTTQADDARRAVAAAGHTGDVDAARRGLTHDGPEVRATALRALVRLKRATPEVVRSAADDIDPIVRMAACEAALHLSDSDAAAVVGPLLDDDHPSVVEAAAFAAGELGTAAEPLLPRLMELTRHGDTIVRETVVAALGAIGDPAALPAILVATKDRATVRRRAIIALAPFDGTDVDEARRAALDDRDWQVRQAAEDQIDPHEETP
jgi:HEAT repeat protein